MKEYKIGIIGFGKMGREHFRQAQNCNRWRVVRICDLCEENLQLAKELDSTVEVCKNVEDLFNDESLDAISICTLADARPELIYRAMAKDLHILAEKPLAADIIEEKKLMEKLKDYRHITTVNLFNRNMWYHQTAHELIAAGEIGDIAVIRICHMTQKVLPPDFHNPEGAIFHDCGMHYVDAARWYAKSEFADWHAVGQRMFNEPLPLWVSVHGHFQNSIAFEITNGFIYALHAKEPGNNSYFDIIGTHGTLHLSHDFVNARLFCRGINETFEKTAPYGGKSLDVMFTKFAHAIDTGNSSKLPQMQDSIIASELSQKMVDAVMADNPPNIGTSEQLAAIREYRTV